MSQTRGFTLLELVVAVAVFGVMAAVAYAGLNSIALQERQLLQHARALAKIQKALFLLGNDLMHATPRSVRDELGSPEPALLGEPAGNSLAFTPATSTDTNDSGLIRVEYAQYGGTLQRRLWQTLDRTPETRPLGHDLLEGIESLQFRYFGPTGWRNSWPIDTISEADLRSLPLAVEIVIETRDDERYRRVFRVAGSG